MSKTMLVNVTHVEESRVAIVDDGVLSAYEIETATRASLKGNIHNATVESVHPSLEAAFVRITHDQKGFLPIDEVNFKLLPARSDSRKAGKIGQHLREGQKLMVQIVREPFADKPPTVSTYFSLPGRFLVLMPGVDAGGVSRKIEDTGQREELKRIVDELTVPEGFGVIVRTAGVDQTKGELQRDLRYLLRLWESIQRSSRGSEFPALVYREADLVIRTIRDHFTKEIDEVWIDSQEVYDRALAFVGDVMPTKAKSLRLYRDDRPLFNKFDLEEQIERIYKRRVPLPSGGEIVIDGTEALTAIDVNSARSRRKGDAEEIVLQTNLEAAAEIARQLQLRDLGGLVVIDFIDMAHARNNLKVEKAMRDALKSDKARHDVTRMSKLGLMELSRQRLKGAKLAASYATCPTCDGFGWVKNVETAALAALRKLQARATRGQQAVVKLSLPPEVANWILNNKREELVRMGQRGPRIEILPDAALRRHENRFEITMRERVAEVPVEPRIFGETPAEVEQAGRGEFPDDEVPAPREPAMVAVDTEKADRPAHPRSDRRRRDRNRGAARNRQAGGVQDRPAGGAHRNAGAGEQDRPSGGAHRNAAGGEQDRPPGGAHRNAAGGEQDRPSGGAHRNALGGDNDRPSSGAHGNAASGEYDRPSSDANALTAGDTYDHPSSDEHERTVGDTYEGPDEGEGPDDGVSGGSETRANTARTDGTGGRRRRRRRRRGRGAPPEAGAPPETRADEPARKEEPVHAVPVVNVPRGVRSDELMPAAVGSTTEQRAARRRGGAGRRRRRPGGRDSNQP